MNELAKEQLTKEQFTKEESNKNKANVCTDTNSIEFHFYDGANIPSNAIVKIQEFAGNKFKITHTQNIYKLEQYKKTVGRYIC